MSKPKVKQNTYYKVGIVLGVVMAGLASLGTYTLIENSLEVIKVPVANPSTEDGIIKKGDLILKEDITLMEIGSFNFPGNIIRDPKIVVNKYASSDMRKGEFFYNYGISENYQKTLSEKVRYGAVSVPIDLISSVNADIQEDDFVMVKIIMGSQDDEDSNNYSNVDTDGKLPDSGITIIDDELLAAVRVVGFYESSGGDITKKKAFNNNNNNNMGEEQSLSPRMIVFDANPIQQALLLQGAYGGKIQLIILPEEEQVRHKIQWGLLDQEGNVVQEPIFEDDTADIKQQAEDLKAETVEKEEDADRLRERVEARAREHALECEDPFTCKDPIHYGHVCPEEGECDHPIHHVIECEIVDCDDPAHDAVTLD